MKGKEILKKVVVSFLILSMSFSSVSVAAEVSEGSGPVIEQSLETSDEEESFSMDQEAGQDVSVPEDSSQKTEEGTQTPPGEDVTAPPETSPDGSETENGGTEDGSLTPDDNQTESGQTPDDQPPSDPEKPEDENPSKEEPPATDENIVDPSGVPETPETTDPSGMPAEDETETLPEENGDITEETEDFEEETEDSYIVLPASEENEYHMTPDELGELEEDRIGYAAWQDQPRAAAYGMRRSAPRDVSDNWSFDVSYAGESGRDLRKTEDFHLKYQMEFHTSRAFLKDQLRIRVRRALLDKRDGKGPVDPAQIAAPPVEIKDGKEVIVRSEDMPFAYRIVEEDGIEYLEFFNYEEIAPGTNLMWQILYKDVKLMDIVDMSAWSLEPEITVYGTKTVTVKGEEGEEEQEKEAADRDTTEDTRRPEPLTGIVDSYVELTGITKEAYKENDRSYTPELYTLDQLRRYAELPGNSKFITKDGNGKETLNSGYRYIVWRVTMKGRANQPWAIRISETPALPGGAKGEIVGYKDASNAYQGYPTPINPSAALNAPNGGVGIISNPNNYKYTSSWSSRFYVVTAYPADEIEPDHTELENTIQITAVPLDGKDDLKDQSKTASAKRVYEDYEWTYLGNTITVDKRNPDNDDTKPYTGWLEVYEKLSKGGTGEDYGSIPFTASSSYRDYGYTHTTVTGADGSIGTYQNGKKYKLTTADDFMYAMVDDYAYPLTGADYYFTGVTVRQTDTGWDVWEDQAAEPEAGGDLVISAWYEGSTDWETADTVPWTEFVNGKYTYEFTDEQLARRPWRVKAEHETTGYSTSCSIDVTVCIRKNSPVMQSETVSGWKKEGGNWTLATLPGILQLYNKNLTVRFENLVGVIGQRYNPEENSWSVVSDSDLTGSTSGNYSEPGLQEATGELYKETVTSGSQVRRDNAFRPVTGLEPWAASAKQLIDTTNDVSKSRGQAVYSLTAHDGYRIYSEEAVADLKRENMPSPGRQKVAFYDLLPYGMNFDPSYTVRAGRITDLDANKNYEKQPGLWDTNDVSVTWETIENHNNTGRTLVIFRLAYTGADAAVYTRQNWLEGWGVSFRAYYDWKDRDLIKANANLSAFMPDEAKGEDGYGTALLGKTAGQTIELGCSNYSEGKNDGKFTKYEQLIGLNLIGDDSIQDVRNVLYAENGEVDDLAVNSRSTLKKRVKADADLRGSYQKTAAVEAGEDYTYEITVSADQSGLSDLILYDAIENLASVQEDSTNGTSGIAGDSVWNGTFRSAELKGLTDMGAAPVVYYSAYERAARPDVDTAGSQAFTDITENGNRVWYTESEFTAPEGAGKTLADVKSIALDLRTKSDGTPYTLGANQSLSFRIHMQAPAAAEENKPYAYNTSSYHSNTTDTANGWQQGDYTKVRLAGTADLEVEKAFDTTKMSPTLRESMKDTSFEFTLSRDGAAFEYKPYELYTKNADGEWNTEPERTDYTDKDGRLYLKADEKAVFRDVVDVKSVEVAETPNIFWESQTAGTQPGSVPEPPGQKKPGPRRL